MKQEESHSRPDGLNYQKELKKSILRFQNALSGYENASDQEIGRIQAILTEEMPLMIAAAKEIKLLGAEKQAFIVESDFKRFVKNPSKENLTILQQDVTTLNEYGIRE